MGDLELPAPEVEAGRIAETMRHQLGRVLGWDEVSDLKLDPESS
jgi:hypothetical protein